MSADGAPEVAQERDTLAARAIVLVALAAAVIGSLAVVASSGLQGHYERAPRGGSSAARAPSERAPQVLGVVEQTLADDVEDGLAARRRGEREIQRYAWVDRARGVARIPIERAIDVYVAAHRDDAGAR